jgi:hypothetical protein
MLWGGAMRMQPTCQPWVAALLSSVSVLCLAMLLFNLLRKWGFMFTS